MNVLLVDSAVRAAVVVAVKPFIRLVPSVKMTAPVLLVTQHSALFHASVVKAVPSGTVDVAEVVVAVPGQVNDL